MYAKAACSNFANAIVTAQLRPVAALLRPSRPFRTRGWLLNDNFNRRFLEVQTGAGIIIARGDVFLTRGDVAVGAISSAGSRCSDSDGATDVHRLIALPLGERPFCPRDPDDRYFRLVNLEFD